MSVLRIAADLHPSPLQLYGKRAAWEDPSKWVNDTYPWNAAALHREGQSLLQLRPEDVGYDGYSSSKEGASSKPVSQSDTEGDPLVRETHTGEVPGVQRIGHPFVITASPKQQQKQNKTVFLGLRWCFWILGVSHPDSCFFFPFLLSDEHAATPAGGGQLLEHTELRQRQHQSPRRTAGLLAGVGAMTGIVVLWSAPGAAEPLPISLFGQNMKSFIMQDGTRQFYKRSGILKQSILCFTW